MYARYDSMSAITLELSLSTVNNNINNNNNNNNEHICNVQFKQSSNASLLHYRADVKSVELPCKCLDGRRQALLVDCSR